VDSKWNALYVSSSVANTALINDLYDDNNTSDRRLKKNIENLSELYNLFFDKINPVRYKYINGTSDRYHTGFIAQDLVQALKES
jgi:hypothetical protein